MLIIKYLITTYSPSENGDEGICYKPTTKNLYVVLRDCNNLLRLTPLSSKSDKYLFSPYDINT